MTDSVLSASAGPVLINSLRATPELSSAIDTSLSATFAAKPLVTAFKLSVAVLRSPRASLEPSCDFTLTSSVAAPLKYASPRRYNAS